MSQLTLNELQIHKKKVIIKLQNQASVMFQTVIHKRVIMQLLRETWGHTSGTLWLCSGGDFKDEVFLMGLLECTHI
jgi:hypothetical protein